MSHQPSKRSINRGFLLLFFSAIALLVSIENIGQGLVAFYPFSGNPNDASGNAHHGQLQNGVQLTSDRFGNPNSAYYFDGIDDYIKIADNGAFSTPHFSIGIWFQSQSTALQNLVGKRDYLTAAGSGGAQYQFFINYPPFPGIGSNIVSNTASCLNVSFSSYISTGNVICSNRWYFAVVTFDGNRHKIYIDGVLVRDVATPFNGMLPCNSELRFGNWWSLDLITFKGTLDDICWYNRAITQTEVDSIFNNFSSPTSPVDFTFSQDACDPLRINFLNNTAGIQSSTWYFGDGNTSNTTSPVHIYAAQGNYTVKLIITNSAGCTDSIIKSISVNINYSDIIVNRDTSICLGQSVPLNVLPGSDFCWPVTQYLSASNVTSPVATPSQTITYYFNSKQLGTNLLVNGNFSGGNTGFTSEYSYVTPNSTDGQYFIGPSPNAWNGSMSSCNDHTGSNGNMMLINGSPIANAKVWCQTVAVSPNTNYEFSSWVQSLIAFNPAQLQFSINGVQVGQILNGGNVCNWQRYSGSWNSGVSATATICIENKNTIALGNAFALDDITLSPVILRRDSVKITVLPAPNVFAGIDTSICQGQSVQLNASGAININWLPITGLSDPNIANPVANPLTTTQYIVSGYDDPACIIKDTVVVTVAPLPVFGINPGIQNICDGNNFTITATGSDTYSWFTATQNSLSSTSQLIYSNTINETYFVAVNNIACNIFDTLSAAVNILARPNVTLIKSNDIDCSTPQAQLTATGGITYSWTPSTNINNSSIPDPIVYPDVDTWFKVVVRDNNGCFNSDSILVKSDLSRGQASFFVPSAFTPNNDGLNDCFGVPYWSATEEFELSVYNRWGELVFRTSNKSKCWDGKFKGLPQPGGVFVYQISGKSRCSNNKVYKKGTVALIRQH